MPEGRIKLSPCSIGDPWKSKAQEELQAGVQVSTQRDQQNSEGGRAV